MNFGPSFQSLSEVQSTRHEDTLCCRASIKPLEAEPGIPSEYVVHPITIDALFQAALQPVTSDSRHGLTGKVPVSIASARFSASQSEKEGSSLFANAVSRALGFGSVMSCCELRNSVALAQITDLQFVTYQAASQEGNSGERHPMLRSVWKPDISRYIASDPINLEKALLLRPEKCNDDLHGIRNLIALVELLTHKDPRLQILDLSGNSADMTGPLLKKLRVDTAFKRFSSYELGYLSEAGDLFSRTVESFDDIAGAGKETPQKNKQYDLVILPFNRSDHDFLSKHLPNIGSLLHPGGVILGTIPESTDFAFPERSTTCSIGSGNQRVVVGKCPADQETAPKQEQIVLVGCEGEERFNNMLRGELTKHFGKDTRLLSLSELTPESIKPGDTVVSALELHSPVFSTLGEESMSRVKFLTNNARNLVWITGLAEAQPELSLVRGLSRTLRLEQPSLRFFVFSAEYPRSHHGVSMRNIITTVEEALKSENPDTEFSEHEGLVYISRFVPDEKANEMFQQRQRMEPIANSLADVKPVQLAIQSPGQFDTVHMARRTPWPDALPADYLELDVKSVGMNAKNVYAFAGKLDVKDGASAFECAGTVTKVGSRVSSLAPGDRVLSMALCQLSTVERVPQWACVKLLDSESFHAASTLPTVFATAIYGLCDRANLQAGETVLIHSAAGGVGIAAIQIARLRGAEIFATVGTEEKKSFLVQSFGLKPENIFSSRNLSFVPGILAATGNRGVDVVLNSLTGELLHESWRLCAKFGRFVEIGKYDLFNAGKLDMQVFLRSASFIAFDLAELYDPENPSSRETHPVMLRRIMNLYRAGQIRPIEPLKVFDISEAAQALRHFSSSNRIGKVTLSFENDQSQVKTPLLQYSAALNPSKTYLMVGCLGGLGRSVSRWMLERGCRNFVFLGRSGLDKKAAANLVQDLRAAGANVVVVRGDVTGLEDVKKCVSAAGTPVGGVIHAAMGLKEALWTSMSPEAWHTGLEPKVTGAWNLHHALQGKDQDLEFFLMTSSISGSLGATTESNYCSANCFLDNFARYRRRLGLPATSVGLGMISEVGYVHENPEVEHLLLRKGIQPIGEQELLQILDLALSPPGNDSSTSYDYDPYASSHIITGLEPFALRDLRAKGFDVSSPTAKDPRASLLEAAFDGDNFQHRSGGIVSLCEDAEGKPILDIIIGLIKDRLSSLILQSTNQIDENQSLARFGLDSMLASELRTWIYWAFEADISFLSLLSNSMTLRKIGEKLAQESPAARE